MCASDVWFFTRLLEERYDMHYCTPRLPNRLQSFATNVFRGCFGLAAHQDRQA